MIHGPLSQRRATSTFRGPWTPTVISSSMSADRLGPVMNTMLDGSPGGNHRLSSRRKSPGVANSLQDCPEGVFRPAHPRCPNASRGLEELGLGGRKFDGVSDRLTEAGL